MKPEEILRNAKFMAAQRPHDKLRLRGVEVMALVEYVTDWVMEGVKARRSLTSQPKKPKRGAK